MRQTSVKRIFHASTPCLRRWGIIVELCYDPADYAYRQVETFGGLIEIEIVIGECKKYRYLRERELPRPGERIAHTIEFPDLAGGKGILLTMFRQALLYAVEAIV